MAKKITRIACCLVLFVFSEGIVLAASADKKLQQFFQDTKSMQAEFSQSVVSDSKPNVDRSTGVLQMERPGKFRWDYQFPYQQQIVADGRKLWVYDIEMEQVIVKPLDLVLGNTPAVLLSGNADIADKFNVEEITAARDNDKGYFWMQLTPKQEEAGFEKLLLAFAGNKLQIMELKDAFGQVTRIVFSNLVTNSKIDPAVFDFKIPAGVDVIDDTKSGDQ